MPVEPVTVSIETEDPSIEAALATMITMAAEKAGLSVDQMQPLTATQHPAKEKPQTLESTIEPVLDPIGKQFYHPVYDPDPAMPAGSILTDANGIPLRGEPMVNIIPPPHPGWIYSFSATFGEKPVIIEPEPLPEVVEPPCAWPTERFPRGARWHGAVPDGNGGAVHADLISTGDELVLISSPEGQAILADLA